MPRPLFLALATYPRAVDRELLEARDADFLAWLEKHEYALSLEREHSEDEDEGRVFAVFENTGSHHTRRGMEFFASRLYRQTWQLFNDLREQCGELSFSLRRKDSSSPGRRRVRPDADDPGRGPQGHQHPALQGSW